MFLPKPCSTSQLFKVVWRMLLFEGPRKGNLNDFSAEFRGGISKTFYVDSVQNVPIRVGVNLGDFSEDDEIENWPFRELV